LVNKLEKISKIFRINNFIKYLMKSIMEKLLKI